MIDWSRFTGFDWDAGNDRKNVNSHNVSQAEADSVFFNQPLLILSNPTHSLNETRWSALGTTDNHRALYISFTLRANNTKIRVISARDMSRKERATYEKAT